MMKTFKDKKRMGYSGFTLIELMIVIAIIGILAAVAIPNFLRAKNKSSYTACLEQLSNVKTGLESFMSENDNLQGVDATANQVCNHILPGFDSAADCDGLVAERVDGANGVCEEGSFSVTFPDDYTYEIEAVAKEKTKCAICVTELTATPAKYDECSAPPGCIHAQ